MKKIDTITKKLEKGKEKLREIKEKYNNDSKKITELIQMRANLLADEAIEEPNSQKKAEIKKVNEELENLKRSIEGRPELIAAVEEKLKVIQAKKGDEELRISYEKQKIVGKKAVELSEKLIEGLEECNRTNDELRKNFTELNNLGKITKKGVFKPEDKTTLGSFECLRMLLVTLRQEYSTGRPRSCQQCRIMQW